MSAKFILLFTLCAIAVACSSQQKKAAPKNLNEAILYLKQSSPKAQLDEFKQMEETKAVAEMHFSTGMWIRNKWLWGNRNPPLINYFKSLGLNHPDDISSVIITSLHRELNGKNIDLEGQIKVYLDYWKTISDCDSKQSEIALSTFKQFNKGDKVSIYMPVPEDQDGRNAVYYMCPNENWTFDGKKDLKIEGIVVKKYNINSPKNVFFKVRITSLNRNDTEILMKKVSVGDDYDFSLSGLKVEPL